MLPDHSQFPGISYFKSIEDVPKHPMQHSQGFIVVFYREGERECVCVRERERERECVCACVCVCERERERERERFFFDNNIFFLEIFHL